jgi:hypothetical protein
MDSKIEIEGFTNNKLIGNEQFNKSIYLTKLPTKDWLIKKEIIFHDEKVYILISKLFTKNTIIIKLNYKNDNFIEYYINKLLINSKIPNIIKIYGVIKCNESKENIKLLNELYSKHIDVANKTTELFKDGYCNGNKNNSNINLTVMKKYNKQLDDVKLNLKEVFECIFQIIMVQILMYKDYGILHNDMTHEGNMFIEDNTDVLKYEYNVKNIKNIYIRPSKKIILFDFDKSEIIYPNFRKKYLNFKQIDLNDRNILNNISDSIETIFRRLDDLNPPKEVIEIKNGLKQSIENIKVLWKYHINAINDIIKLKNNNDNEKSIKECVGEFTI